MKFCPSCGTERAGVFCGACGFRFPEEGLFSVIESDGAFDAGNEPGSEFDSPSIEVVEVQSAAAPALPGTVVVKVDGVVHRFTGQGKITIGRADTNDVVIEDKTVSRRHCEIGFDEANGEWQIFDLASANGVQIDGSFVVEATLSRRNNVRLGENDDDVEFTIEIAQSQQDAPKPKPVSRPLKPQAVSTLPAVDSQSDVKIQMLAPVVGLKYGDGFDPGKCCANCGQLRRLTECATCDR